MRFGRWPTAFRHDRRQRVASPYSTRQSRRAANLRGHQSTLQSREAWLTFADWIDQTNPRFGYEVSEIFHFGAGLSDDRVAEAKAAWLEIVAHMDAILKPDTFSACRPRRLSRRCAANRVPQ